MKTDKPVFNPASHPEMTPQEYSLYHRRSYQAWYRKTHKKSPGSAPVAFPTREDGAREQRRRECQRRWRLAQKTKNARQNNGGNGEAIPAYLNECCFCHARFFAVKGSA
jgi:hypothetical protein